MNIRKLKKGVLKGTEVGAWPKLDETLKMLQGADRAQRTVGKERATGIEIPLEAWKNLMDAPATAA